MAEVQTKASRHRRPKTSEEARRELDDIQREAREARDLEFLLFNKGAEEIQEFLGREQELDTADETELDFFTDIGRTLRADIQSAERDQDEPSPGQAVLKGEREGDIITDVAGSNGSVRRAPVWVDDEEEEGAVNLTSVNRLKKLRTGLEEEEVTRAEYLKRLRSQHAKLNRGTDWARLPVKGVSRKRLPSADGEGLEGDEEEESLGEGELELELREGELVTADRDVLARSKTRLAAGILEATRMRDANEEEPCKAVVQSVQFHPNGQLLLTASKDKTLRFFQVDGKQNPKVQSVFLEDMPIFKAAFTSDGSKVVAAGRRKWFYTMDILSGKIERVQVTGRDEKSLESFALSPDNSVIAFLGNEGHLMLVSQKSRQWIGNLKMNGSVRTAAFTPSGQEIVTSGGDGEIYHWDLRTRRCIHRGRDEGCVNSTSLAVSVNGKLMAAGSDSGVVNLYNRQSFLGGVPTPKKSLLNLTTTVDTLAFNHDSQILAMASRMKKDSLRLVHLPSQTVFSNWPTSRSPLHYVHSLDFSPGGGYLAVGNAKGKVLLYRLHHYDQA